MVLYLATAKPAISQAFANHEHICRKCGEKVAEGFRPELESFFPPYMNWRSHCFSYRNP